MMSGLMTMCRVVIAITPGSPKNRSLATYLLPVKVRGTAEPCLQLPPRDTVRHSTKLPALTYYVPCHTPRLSGLTAQTFLPPRSSLQQVA